MYKHTIMWSNYIQYNATTTINIYGNTDSSSDGDTPLRGSGLRKRIFRLFAQIPTLCARVSVSAASCYEQNSSFHGLFTISGNSRQLPISFDNRSTALPIAAVWQYPPDSGGVARQCCAASAVPLHVLSIKFRVNSEAVHALQALVQPPHSPLALFDLVLILKSDFPTLYPRLVSAHIPLLERATSVYVALWLAVSALYFPLTPSKRLLYPLSPRISQPSSTKGLVLRFVVVVPL
ncbi:hypothetical protein OE88DRAFT_1801029 [Heliocybe sulcata]|uniref:Uncharacterized protein n=1 Tax=Heliocybe sulcata TaxID=5364 RepID=A0A5C3N5Q3_9AGAM|nr:hypothetical protein OE88DRAFT_1801029 [Heliocybe sulcata]